jgi:hypothetical protein
MVYFHAFIGLVILLFLGWQLVWPMRKYKVAAGALLFFLALGAFKFPLIRLLGGNRFFAPDLPGWVLHLGGFFYGWILFSFVILIPAAIFFSVWQGYCKFKKKPFFSEKTISCLLPKRFFSSSRYTVENAVPRESPNPAKAETVAVEYP